ncbi:hypothetical protein BpHYR1_008022, partial [Brachionus plicatilis]
MVSDGKNQIKMPANLTIVINSFKKKCADSTAHGLPRIFGSEFLAIKIIWSIFFSIGIIGAIT